MKKIKDYIYLLLRVMGIIILVASIIVTDLEMGVFGILALIMSDLNDVENKLDRLNKSK